MINTLDFGFLSHMGRLLKVERLPEDFIVYKKQTDAGYIFIRTDGIPAKNAITSCCNAIPVKYYPDHPSNTGRWWLICASCKSAISANGDAA